jgi:hypothetical protein
MCYVLIAALVGSGYGISYKLQFMWGIYHGCLAIFIDASYAGIFAYLHRTARLICSIFLFKATPRAASPLSHCACPLSVVVTK